MSGGGDKTITLIIDAKNLASAQLKGLQRDLKGVSDEGARNDAILRRGGQAAKGVLAVGFAAAAVGASQLSDEQARLQSATGLSADASHELMKAVNDIAGASRQSLPSVTGAMEKVVTDLHLTGTAAEDATRGFVNFARVTGQDSSESVSSFKTILDAWNLTAADSSRLMDDLVVSHQKFGGSVAESEAALGAMAPAMQAASMSVSDGIALLNLFEEAGVSASKAPAMLAKAVAQLKPGQTLNDLIAQVGAIEDPTLRAQRAMEIFGKKAGVGMAQAIKPGMTSLEDIKAELGNTAGAAQKAADDLDSSFPARIQIVMSRGAEAVRGFGDIFGPAMMAATGSVSLWQMVAGSLGLSLSGALKGAWVRMSSDPGVLGAATAAGEAEGAATAAGIAGSVATGVASIGVVTIPIVLSLVAGGNAQGTRDSAAAAIVNDTVYQLRARAAALRSEIAGMGPGVEMAAAMQALGNVNRAIASKSLEAGRATAAGWSSAFRTAMSHTFNQMGNASGVAYAEGIRTTEALIRAVWQDAQDARRRAADDADRIIVNDAEIAAQRRILADRKATAAQKAEARIRIRALEAENAAVTAEMTALGAKAVGWGERVDANLATGLYHGRKLVRTAAGVVAQDVTDHLQVRSPAKAGPLSEGGGPEGYGSRLVGLYAAGMTGARSAVASASSSVASAALLGGGPSGSSAGLGSLSGGPGGAGATPGGLAVHLHVTTMAAPTRAQVADMADTLDAEFRRRYARFSPYEVRP